MCVWCFLINLLDDCVDSQYIFSISYIFLYILIYSQYLVYISITYLTTVLTIEMKKITDAQLPISSCNTIQYNAIQCNTIQCNHTSNLSDTTRSNAQTTDELLVFCSQKHCLQGCFVRDDSLTCTRHTGR